MVLVRVSGGKLERRWVFSLGLLLLVTARSSTQQAGVSLMFLGVTLPSDSIVDFDDVLNIGSLPSPSNRNPASANASLQCITDLVDCCGNESGTVRTERGNWYFPDGHIVEFSVNLPLFLANRGPNEFINGQRFYGSVRLFRRFSNVPERGRFRCELPSAANPSVNQIVYVNILNFGFYHNLDHVIISPSTGSTATIAGQTDYSLICSSTLFQPSRLPSGVPLPNFQWSFDGSSSLPSGVTAMATVMSSSNSTSETYTSTLQLNSPLSQSLHAGVYTCQLGPGRLVNSVTVTVNVGVSVQITASGTPTLGQNGYSLICGITATENLNLSITYQWTKNSDGTQVGSDQALSFSFFRFSDAGWYTCEAIVRSPFLNGDISIMDTHDVTIQIPAPTLVILSSSVPNPIPPGSPVTLTCAVELSPAVNISVAVNTVLTTPAGFQTHRTAELVIGSLINFTSEFVISPFRRIESGLFICGATVSLSSNAYISDSRDAGHTIRITTGVYLSLRNVYITNNSNVNIRSIDKIPSGALQCITDNLRCCSQDSGFGEWYQPNGTLVQGTTSTTAFYRSREHNGEVSLNRPSGIASPTGRFCCEVPDATSTHQTLCVNIGGVFISIPSDPPIAGESYTLECSAGGSEGTFNFQWLGPPDGRTIVTIVSGGSITISSTSTTSQLQFRPVQQSDNSSYSCNATTNGLTLSTESVVINVNAPTVSVQINDNGATQTAGEDNYRLTCSVSGAENLNPTITYRWTKNSGSGETQLGASSSILSFTPLRLSNAANYVCEVTVSSSYLASDIIAMNSLDIRLHLPTPSSITLMSSDHSSRSNSLPILGSNVTLTCTFEFNAVILASEIRLLMVDTQLFRNGTLLTLTGPIVSGTTFTYTTQLNSFGRSDSGNYTCTASVRLEPTLTYLTGNETLSTTVNIKAASAPPMNVVATQSGSSAPVEVSWSPPPDGANIITGYRIFYGSGKNASVSAVATYVGLKVDGNYIGQNISVRSEGDQLYSELINTSISLDNNQLLCARCADPKLECSCSSEIGIAIGVSIVAECLVVMVTTVVLCLWRKRSARKKSNIAISRNMAYGEVHLKPGMMTSMEGEYENPDKISCGQWNETIAESNYETIGTSKQQHAI